MGLKGIALILLGASAVYCATFLATRGLVLPGKLDLLALALMAAASGLVLGVCRRQVNHDLVSLSQQLEIMTAKKQFGLLMSDGIIELTQITHPINELILSAHKQMEDLQVANRELQIQARVTTAEKSHAEAIIFSISDAVIVTNRFDELILANQAAEDLLGFVFDGHQRKNIDEIITDGTLVRLIRETRSCGRSFTRKGVEHSIDYKGSPRTFSITLSCVVAPDEEVSGVVAVLHDVTREKEIAQMKTDFVSDVSHELKTPLASIKAYVEMLRDGEAKDARTQQEFYEIIAAEVDRLHHLIENILDISRIESGMVKMTREPVHLTEVVRHALDVAAPQAKAKGICLVERFAPVHHPVEADRDMIYRAALNLLSNAIKYTPEGGMITVSVSADERRGVAVCEVADTGAGIPAADLPHVFDKFYRVKANSKLAKGTGLGLTLVKHIIETAHEGKVSVMSETGKGSTFSFELPLLKRISHRGEWAIRGVA
jgi:two-component system phosphate regulon sensor histidine kinase PhoR